MVQVPCSRVLAAGLLLFAAAVAAQPPAALSDPARAAIDGAAAAFLESNRVPGLSLAVVRRGVAAYCQGFGSTSLSAAVPATCDTLYRIASVTKPLTAVAVLQLAAAGKLSLEDSASDRCPELPKKTPAPTIRQLLAHQGGVRHPTDREDTTIRGPFERASEAVRLFGADPLEFRPGSATLYSSWGYALLGCVIENASGQPYMDYLRTAVLLPAGMTATVRDSPDFAAPAFSPGFRLDRRGARLVPAEVVDTRFKTPASGLVSSAADLGRFAAALYAGRLLSAPSLAELFSPQKTADGKTTDFTLGWSVGRETAFGQAFYQAGSMEGATALVYLVPERELAVVLLANRERFAQETAALVPRITEIVLGSPAG